MKVLTRHCQNHGLTFVLVPPLGQEGAGSDEHLDEFIDEGLRAIRRILDNPSMSDLLQPVSSAPSRAIILDERTSTTNVVSTSSYTGDPHLLAASELFQM